MKYLVTKDENNNAFVTTPVPKSYTAIQGFYLLLNQLPALPSGHKYVIENGRLTTSQETAAETLNRIKHLKLQEYRKIDRSTQEELANGFVYNQKNFPLDQESQNLYNRIYLKSIAGTYQDQNIPTSDFNVYLLSSANVAAFFEAYHTTATSINEAARAEKEQITT